MKYLFLSLIIAAIILSYISVIQHSFHPNNLKVTTNDSTMLSKDSLMNCFLFDSKYKIWIKLTNGKHETTNFEPDNYLVISKDLVDYFTPIDLNKDGVKDAIGFTYTCYGGSATYLRMEAFINFNGSPKHLASLFLDDRTIIQYVKIVNDTINLYLVIHGPDDSMCCPTKKVKWSYIYLNNQFLKINKD